MRSIAADFLTRCFAPDETIALLLRRDNPISTLQRVVPLEGALASRYLGWLAHENATGANVYVAANPLRSGSRRRTKESMAAVRHLYVDIDTDGETRLGALRASDAAPTPNVVLTTSPGKYQVLWRVDGFGFERQESTLKILSFTFGGDSACTDCNRVLRVPGFRNCKYDPAHVVTIQYQSDCAYSPADFHPDIPTAEAALSTRVNAEQKHPGRHTHSEHDWAWVSHELVEGKVAAKLTRVLASRRFDKPNPLYYAQRTVDVASARLWLLEGIRIDDEIPSTLCSARAREIALTAQRMIARRKIA
jgi:hypothetical protein